jgi:dTDP-4-dehydrorhamnose reductase
VKPGGAPKILVTGAGGQLGAELVTSLRAVGDVVATTRASLDVSDADAVAGAFASIRPDIVVNAAAYTAVDRAETERARAFAVNADGPGFLAEASQRTGAMLVHYSTDYVFDGAASAPYEETTQVAPLSVYGESKLEGERRVAASGASALVFRTSWVYALEHANFLTTIRRLATQRDELRIVDDQIGVPNWSRALARATARVLGLDRDELAARTGLYHLTCAGETTWFRFAEAFLRDMPRVRLVAITTAEYPTPARRPRYGVLDTTKFVRAFGFALPDWRDTLKACLSDVDIPL